MQLIWTGVVKPLEHLTRPIIGSLLKIEMSCFPSYSERCLWSKAGPSLELVFQVLFRIDGVSASGRRGVVSLSWGDQLIPSGYLVLRQLFVEDIKATFMMTLILK